MSGATAGVSLGVCVASNRPGELAALVSAWVQYWKASEGPRVRLYLHEDLPEPSATALEVGGLPLVRTCQRDIDARLGADGWIIPRRSGASRSFPMLLAWRDGCDYLLTLDDDCRPADAPERFLARHLEAFQLDRWFRTIDGEEPRGIPYGDRGRLPVLLNHGTWAGTPDLDGPTALRHLRAPQPVVLRAAREVVPPGMSFPLCAMNVCYARAAVPAAYNLLMGLEAWGLDRFDDIWSGLFLKRVADRLGLYVTSGVPFVFHARASSPWVNLRKEALGIEIHEHLWQHVAAAPLAGTTDVASTYLELADWIAAFPAHAPAAPGIPGYFEKLAEAMRTWVRLCRTSREPA